MHVRPLERIDRLGWERLWRGYLAFYQANVPESVFDVPFERLLTDEAYEPNALVAVRNGSLVGLVHFLEHRHCWKTENVIYLQDLFAAPTARGLGVGRALIEAVYDIAVQTAAGTVYWTTENTNETAMRLYDKLATRTKFIKYQR